MSWCTDDPGEAGKVELEERRDDLSDGVRRPCKGWKGAGLRSQGRNRLESLGDPVRAGRMECKEGNYVGYECQANPLRVVNSIQ